MRNFGNHFDTDSGFSGFVCYTNTTGWPWMSTQPCSSPYADGQFNFRAISVVDGVTTTTRYPASTLSGFAIYAYSVQIRWQNGDTTTSTSATSSMFTTSSAITTAHNRSELSIGEKCGIGVAVAATVGILLGVAVYFILRRRRRPRHQRLLQPHLSSGSGPGAP